MKTMNTDTPETDGEWNRLACQDHPEFERNLADFARKLERERDEVRDAAEKAKAYKRVLKQTNAQLKRERDEHRKLADDAMIDAQTCSPSNPPNMKACGYCGGAGQYMDSEGMPRMCDECYPPPNPADSPVIYGASLVIPTNPSWANSPIHQEVQEWEKESIRAQDVNKPSETLVAERDRLDDQLDQIILRLGETQERMIDAERQRDRLAEALNAILNDDPDSPLYKIKEARAALAAWKEARK
jgi:hypothetical protein